MPDNSPETNIKRIAGRATAVVDGWLTRWQRGMAETRNGSYTLNRWMSDVSAFYYEAVSLALFPGRVIDPLTFGEEPKKPPQASIQFRVDGSSEEMLEAADIADPGTPTVDVNALTLDAKTVIPAPNVQADLAAGGRILVVRLKGMTAYVAGAKKGVYTGTVVPHGQTGPEVATITVEIV